MKDFWNNRPGTDSTEFPRDIEADYDMWWTDRFEINYSTFQAADKHAITSGLCHPQRQYQRENKFNYLLG